MYEGGVSPTTVDYIRHTTLIIVILIIIVLDLAAPLEKYLNNEKQNETQ